MARTDSYYWLLSKVNWQPEGVKAFGWKKAYVWLAGKINQAPVKKFTPNEQPNHAVKYFDVVTVGPLVDSGIQVGLRVPDRLHIDIGVNASLQRFESAFS
jgi:hypothetical protein